MLAIYFMIYNHLANDKPILLVISKLSNAPVIYKTVHSGITIKRI